MTIEFVCLVLLSICLSCYDRGEGTAGKTLSVALYPYLQNMDEAKRIITEIWDDLYHLQDKHCSPR